MNIAFDIDGVFTDYEWFLNTYGVRYLKRHRKNDILKNPEAYTFRERFGCSPKTEYRFFLRYLFWYARKMPVRENVSIVLKNLKKEGHSIHIITARALADERNILGILMRFCVRKWLRKNQIPYDSISYVSVQHSAREKLKLCKVKKIDLFVEDDPVNLAVLKKYCQVICMDTSYNQMLEDVEHAVDFGEIYQIIHNQNMRQLNYHDFMKLNRCDRKKYLYQMKEYYKGMPFDSWFKIRYEKNINRIVKGISWIIRYFFRIQIEGEEHLKQSESVIYICNHRSALDIVLCYYVLNTIPARFLVKEDDKWYRFLQKRIGTIFVVREDKRSRTSAKNTMIHTLLNGGNILLYPEATRNRTSQLMLPFRFGAVTMAQITGCPIVPLVIKKDQKGFIAHIDKPVYVKKMDDLKIKNDSIRKNMCRILTSA